MSHEDGEELGFLCPCTHVWCKSSHLLRGIVVSQCIISHMKKRGTACGRSVHVTTCDHMDHVDSQAQEYRVTSEFDDFVMSDWP